MQFFDHPIPTVAFERTHFWNRLGNNMTKNTIYRVLMVGRAQSCGGYRLFPLTRVNNGLGSSNEIERAGCIRIWRKKNSLVEKELLGKTKSSRMERPLGS